MVKTNIDETIDWSNQRGIVGRKHGFESWEKTKEALQHYVTPRVTVPVTIFQKKSRTVQ